jgi:hypothetical protein
VPSTRSLAPTTPQEEVGAVTWSARGIETTCGAMGGRRLAWDPAAGRERRPPAAVAQPRLGVHRDQD